MPFTGTGSIRSDRVPPGCPMGYQWLSVGLTCAHTGVPMKLPSRPRKPYQKPAVRFERVFETSALTCGKVQSTQSGCHQNRKTS
jgi:hypothetical protein